MEPQPVDRALRPGPPPPRAEALSADVPGKKALGILVALTGLAIALRLPGLGSGLWYDEIVTLLASVRPPLREIVSHFPSSNHHPLYSLLAKAAVAMAGESPWALRLPALVFGILSIPALYLLGVAVTSRRETLVACGILAVSYHHVWFSQNARAYTLLAWAAITATWLLLRGLETGRTRWLVAYGVVVAMGLYAHLTMAFLAAGHFAACLGLLARRGLAGRPLGPLRPAALGFGLAGLIAAALYAPMVLQVTDYFVDHPASGGQRAFQRWALVATVRGLQVGFGHLGAGIALALCALGLVSLARRRPEVALLFVAPGLLAVAASVVVPRPFAPRFLFFLAGFALIALARGIGVIAQAVASLVASPQARERARQVVTAAAFTAVLAASLPGLARGYRLPKQDFEGALRFLEGAAAPGDVVVTLGLATRPYRDYFGMPWLQARTSEDLALARRGGDRVWVVYTLPSNLLRRRPELWAVVVGECHRVATFPGTLAGGEVVVCTLDGD